MKFPVLKYEVLSKEVDSGIEPSTTQQSRKTYIVRIVGEVNCAFSRKKWNSHIY